MFEIPPILHETLAGRYVLKREIGRGGAATVYLAHDVRHERLVAIKLLHRELSHALGAQRFMREIKLTASLQHPHILPIHDSGEANDQLFYVMPFVENESLRQRLQGDSRLSVEEAVRIGREIAGALAYAHERGVVHRDIKPENILFSGGHAILADFGIARAINRAHEKITAQGMITGTPAYMSPEQARDRAFDGRSDVYSLACVLYESIAGVPPFIGETPQQLLTQRFTRTAPLLREYRHDVAPQIESVIAKALAMSPDDRFDDARAFSAALSAAIGNSGETLTQRVARRPLTKSPWLWAGAVAVLMTGGAASTDRGRDQIDILTGRIDTTQYAIIPFQYIGTRSPSAESEPVSQGLYVAMREWKGLKLANDVSIDDAFERSQTHTLAEVLATGRRSRAGRVVWGKVRVTPDSTIVRAVVYDAISGRSLTEKTLAGSRTLLSEHGGLLRGLANDLLRLDRVPRLAESGDIGTRSFAAWQAYQEGQRSLAEWNIAAAMKSLETAGTLDPDYAHAHTWLAQLMVWRGEPASKWSSHLSAAMRNRASLGERETAVVDALHAIQTNQFDEACRAYRTMLPADSLDVFAWIGLAHCQAYDRIVVRNAASPSGWAYRSSMAAAQRAYMKAVGIDPGAFFAIPFTLVTSKLFLLEGNVYRIGVATDSARYFAFPDMVGDTLAYLPREIDKVSQPVTSLAPRTDVALQRNKDTFLQLAVGVTQRMPDNPDAFEALARVLEARDEITGTPNGGYSALSALERAISLSTDSVQRVRLGAFDVRLHLKLGDFGRTAAIGDSLLKVKAPASPEAASYLSGIAALLGKEHLMFANLRASGERITQGYAPSAALLEEVGSALFTRAALGICDDSARTLKTRINGLLASYVSPSQRSGARQGILLRPVQLGVQCFGAESALELESVPQSVVSRLQAFARHDFAGVRRQLDSLSGGRTVLRPGGISLDLTVTDAWLYAATGDTAEAARHLDLTLTALPTLSAYMAREPAMSAAVGRAMALRADLAAAMHDRSTASLWAGRVLTLWAHADPALQPTIRRMTRIVGKQS